MSILALILFFISSWSSFGFLFVFYDYNSFVLWGVSLILCIIQLFRFFLSICLSLFGFLFVFVCDDWCRLFFMSMNHVPSFDFLCLSGFFVFVYHWFVVFFEFLCYLFILGYFVFICMQRLILGFLCSYVSWLSLGFCLYLCIVSFFEYFFDFVYH